MRVWLATDAVFGSIVPNMTCKTGHGGLSVANMPW